MPDFWSALWTSFSMSRQEQRYREYGLWADLSLSLVRRRTPSLKSHTDSARGIWCWKSTWAECTSSQLLNPQIEITFIFCFCGFGATPVGAQLLLALCSGMSTGGAQGNHRIPARQGTKPGVAMCKSSIVTCHAISLALINHFTMNN